MGDRVWDLMMAGIIHNHTGMSTGRSASKAKKAARKRAQASRKRNRP